MDTMFFSKLKINGKLLWYMRNNTGFAVIENQKKKEKLWCGNSIGVTIQRYE